MAFSGKMHAQTARSGRCIVVENLDAETGGLCCLEGGGFAKASPCPWRCDTLARGGSGTGVHHDFPGTLVEERLGATRGR